MSKKAINQLKVVLAQKNKTQRWLAGEIGYSHHAVSRWCTNNAQPPLEVLVQIAEILEVGVCDLLIENEPKK